MIAVLLQVGVNGLLLGGLYAAVAAGFSLVWGVLNIVNILHGSAIVVGSYVAFFAWTVLGLHPFLAAPLAARPLGHQRVHGLPSARSRAPPQGL